MKNAKKIAVIAALLLVALGGIMIAAAAGKGGFTMENLSVSTYEMKTFDVEETFSDIRIEDAECDVRVLPSPDGQCRVICPEKQDGSVFHTVTVTDGVLSVQRHDRRKWYQYIGISFGPATVEVWLPEQTYGQLFARSTSGSVQVDEGFLFETASLESTSGSVRMLSDVKKELRAETSSGRVTVENASPERLAAGSTSGRIALTHIRGGEITARSTAGKIELTDVIAEESLYAKSISGGVALDGCDGGAIRIETTSGSVKGTLLSDKIFFPHSTSGSIKVPRCTSGGECEISTTSGSISIEIIP